MGVIVAVRCRAPRPRGMMQTARTKALRSTLTQSIPLPLVLVLIIGIVIFARAGRFG